MGTEGMKASLVSREVVADSIELVARGHLFDGLVVLSGCDKTNPGAAMAVARLDIPSVILYNGTIYPGTYKGEPQDVVSVFEAIGAYRAGKISLAGALRDRVGGLPGRGRLRRPVHGQHDEHVPGVPGPLAGRAQRHPGRGPAQGRGRPPLRRAGHGPRAPRRATQQHRHPRTRWRTPSPAWPPRAAPRTPSCTCWPSPRSSASPLDIDDFHDRRGAHAAHRRPAAGWPLLRRRHRRRPAASASSSASCSRQGLMHGDADDRDGPDPGGHRAPASRRRPGSRSSGPSSGPSRPRAAWPSCAARLAPDGCVIKLAGHERRHFSGPARVFDSEPACFEAVKRQRIKPGDVVVLRYEGPVGGPGMQEMLSVTARHRRRGTRASRWRCSPTAASAAARAA